VYRAKSDIALELGAAIKPSPELHKPELDFLDGYFAGRRAGK
jgi:hypothetical protein